MTRSQLQSGSLKVSAATLAARRARSQGGATNPKAVGVTAVLSLDFEGTTQGNETKAGWVVLD